MPSGLFSVFFDLVGQISLSIAVLALAAALGRRLRGLPARWHPATTGVIFGLSAFLAVAVHVPLSTVVYSSTALPSVALAGLFGGWAGGAVGVIACGAARLLMDAHPAGPLARTLAAGAAGALFATALQRRRIPVEFRHVFLLCGPVALTGLSALGFGTRPFSSPATQELAIALPITQMAATLLLGGLFLADRHRHELTRRLAESETRLLDVINNLPGTVYQMRLGSDGKLSYIFASKRVQDTMGVTPDQVLADAGAVDSSFFPEEEEDRWRYLRESMKTLRPGQRVFRIRQPNGNVMWARTYSTPKQEPDGHFVWTGFTTDISAEKRKDEELRQSLQDLATRDARLRGIVAAVPGAVYEVSQSADGKVVYRFISDGIQALVGLTPGDLLEDGSRILETYRPEDEPERLRILQESIARMSMRERIFQVTRKTDGARRWLHSRSVPHREPNGEIVWDGVTLDITAQKDLEEELRRSLAEKAASEERLRAIIRSVPGAVYQIRYHRDGTSTYSFLSEGIRDLTGYAANELMADQNVLHNTRFPDEEVDRKASAARSAASMSLRVREFRGRHKDGSVHWYHSRSMPHREADGEVVWDGMTMDITDQKRLEQELRDSAAGLAASEARQRAIIASIPGVVWQQRRTPDGVYRYTYFSEGLRGILGHSAEEVLAHPELLEQAYLPEEQPENLRRSEESRATLALREREFRLRRADGTVRSIYSRAIPHLEPNGEVVWDGFSMDITDQKRLEAELRHSEHMMALAGLVDGVAHNFNNLLQIVSGGAELLLGVMGPGDENRAVAQQILSATDRGAHLVAELRRFSRRQPKSQELVDVNQLLMDLYNLAGTFVGSRIKVLFDGGQGVMLVSASPTRLQTAVLSLILNARDALPNGGKIRLMTRTTVLTDQAARAINRDPGPYVSITVADNGVGMPPEVLKRATEPFFTTKSARQSGMGLSTVHAFVTQLGGHLSLSSQVGIGTDVTVMLPATPDAALAEPPASG